MAFKYQRRTKDNLRERANQSSGDFDSIFKPQYKLYKIKEGKNLIRVLPPTWENPSHYGFDIHVNYGIGADNQAYLSLKKMKNERDPLHEAKLLAERSGDEDLAKALKPRKRVISWIIDRLDEEIGPQILSCPVTLDKGIAGASFDDDTGEIMYIDDPKEGFDVRFYREGSGLNTDYPGEKIKLLNQGPIHEDSSIQAEWLEYISEHPLPECLNYYSYDHIAEVFNGKTRSKNDDEDEKPKRRSRNDDEDEKPVRQRAKVEDEEPPFEEDEKPRKAKPSSEEQEEEAEPEPPKGSSIKDRLAKARAALANKKKPADEEE